MYILYLCQNVHCTQYTYRNIAVKQTRPFDVNNCADDNVISCLSVGVSDNCKDVCFGLFIFLRRVFDSILFIALDVLHIISLFGDRIFWDVLMVYDKLIGQNVSIERENIFGHRWCLREGDGDFFEIGGGLILIDVGTHINWGVVGEIVMDGKSFREWHIVCFWSLC